MSKKDTLGRLEDDSMLGVSTDYDPNSEIFPGGPTQKMIDDWKLQFGSIYQSEFDDDEVYIWRTLTRSEYKNITKIQNADAFYKEETICERCVLWPKNYTQIEMLDGKAGTPSLLAEAIMDKSGFLPNGEAKKL